MAEIEYLTVDHLTTKDLIRFFSKVSIDPSVSWNNTPCWVWTAGRHPKGYGIFWYGKHHKAHRFMFAWLIHPLPVEQHYGEIDHLCKNKPCCNPLHLDFVPTSVNIQRYHEGLTMCKRGHPRLKKGPCSECIKLSHQRQWRKKTPEERAIKNAKLRKWREANHDHVISQARTYASTPHAKNTHRAWAAANRETLNAQARAYNAINRVQIRERQRQWRLNNPEKYKEQTKRNNAKRYLKTT